VSTLSQAEEARIAEWLDTHRLPAGLGTEDEACSVASINLALTGTLTDKIPDCMSEVIGRWIITIQDAMPDEMRNSYLWTGLLPRAAGTGRDPQKEWERYREIIRWMNDRVLATLQPIAEKRGFGEKWSFMVTSGQRYVESLDVAYVARAAYATYATYAADAADAAHAADAADAAYAAHAAHAAGAGDAANAARAAHAAHAADAAYAAGAAAWADFDPPALLAKLIEL
jgi:hypothetical protein